MLINIIKIENKKSALYTISYIKDKVRNKKERKRKKDDVMWDGIREG